MTRYGTLWHTVRATFMHVMVRYDTLWHVVARYGTLWFRSGHNVQETRVKRDAFLTKNDKSWYLHQETSVIRAVFA
jgi:hypothetical protein